MGGAFLAAAVLARAGGRIGLPTIPLFILAGILLGPHTPGVVLVSDTHDLEMLSALGLVLLLFYLELEFHLDDLKAGGRRMALAGATHLALNIGAGLGFGFALGWGTSEALVLAGVLGISSSAIVTKVLVDTGRLGNPETRPILGIIVVEDIFLALYLAALQPILSGADSLGAAALDWGKAFGFLLLLALAARFGTKLVGRLMHTRDDELLVISFLGMAVFVAGVSEWFGVADAIGAFMVGLMLGSTSSGARIRALVHPLRDAFGAIIFFAFGLSINPGDLPSVLWPVLLAVLLTFTMNVLAGLLAGRMYGFGNGPAANIATTLLARGEFALILATMAAGAGLNERLSPFIAGYVLLLAVLGPLAAGRAHWLARLLPAAGRGSLEEPETAPATEPVSLVKADDAGGVRDAGQPTSGPLHPSTHGG
ncbi:cation:proton antiporter [Streptomyces sp. SPB074]|uniref:cation:proton antiporter n=1 Tax=Streptomyces sp. (strain SPB074) TaxID=465543 RepID=UPI00017F21CE|nr:cation:proton antiporter [Streptomyces sp. SPB074]EDY42378.1 Na+/H+ antiporter [Streptomyces sp. SPB074]